MNNNKICILDIETNGDPWTGRIISIAIMNTETKGIAVFYDENEETLIMHFLQFFNKNGFIHIVGFNIIYDIRYIFGKCLKYQLKANGFFKAKTTDLMMILKGLNKSYNYNRPGRLAEWAQLIGRNTSWKSAPVPVLYQQKKIDEIVAYNREHVQTTYELWKRINLVLEK